MVRLSPTGQTQKRNLSADLGRVQSICIVFTSHRLQPAKPYAWLKNLSEARSKTPLPEAHPRLPPLVAARPLPHPPPLVVARPRPRPLPPRGGRWEGGGQVRRVEWTGLHRRWWRGGAHACHQPSPLCTSRPSRHVSVINDNYLVSLMNFNATKVNWDPYIKIHQQSEFKWSISED
jgi:hypothetical protein